MFIRSSTAINDCLIALDNIVFIECQESGIGIYFNQETHEKYALWKYKTQEARDKAFNELCVFLNSNYKLRDFT
jgi:hypothetical protein